jgi:hypothetical protein
MFNGQETNHLPRQDRAWWDIPEGSADRNMDKLSRYESGQSESALLNLETELMTWYNNRRLLLPASVTISLLRANVCYEHAALHAQAFIVPPFEISEPWEAKAGRYSSQTPLHTQHIARRHTPVS